MNDIIIFKRSRSSRGQVLSRDIPRIKIEYKRGTFVVFKKVADLLGAGNRTAIMFGFNKKEKCAYIFKEDPSEDSFFLVNSGRNYYRFTSKELRNFFYDHFELEEGKTSYFNVDSTPNNKGWFRITPEL